MTGVFVLSAVMPNYLVDYLKLTGPQMGFVTSAIGFGGALGQFGLLTVSDFIGRRTTTMLSFIVAAVFLWFFIHTGGANLPMLFGLLFVAAMFNFGDQPVPDIKDNLGFAGFRIHGPINRPDYFDEIGVFLGASYFRAASRLEAATEYARRSFSASGVRPTRS